ncbi:MAG: dprA [Microbacteriaceae bacterium]|jgi:DNA processing protein|nr:dprA [Microbacteriaceae bacterium]
MTLFGLGENELTPLVTAAAGRDLERDEMERLFARAMWTGVAEPGDRIAHCLVESLGPAVALRAVLAPWTLGRIREALREAGEHRVTEIELNQGFERWMPRLTTADTMAALRQAARVGARLLAPGDPLWPSGVDDLGDHAPIALWARGRDDALASLSRSIALVGARAATSYGEHVTMEASAGLVDRGHSILSGAAYGIDGMAHRAALASHGYTVAILAGGVDRFYPSGHDALLCRIVEAGAVVSELPCGQAPTKWRFLQRNRLIAAASLATVVIEAGWRSGALNTAGHAASVGRPVGAVPGPVTSAASAGCHRLIREYAAVCVTNPDQMAELAPLDGLPVPFDRAAVAFAASGHVDDSTRLLDAMSLRAPRDAADIAARSGLSLAATRALLGRLELDGGVAERERGWVRVAGGR